MDVSAVTADLAAATLVPGTRESSRRGGLRTGEVLAEMRRRGIRRAESAIPVHVTFRMRADTPDHHAPTFDDFKQLGRGRHRLCRTTMNGTQ